MADTHTTAVSKNRMNVQITRRTAPPMGVTIARTRVVVNEAHFPNGGYQSGLWQHLARFWGSVREGEWRILPESHLSHYDLKDGGAEPSLRPLFFTSFMEG